MFVCLWAKCHRICCVCLSCHCSVCRTEVDTASGWSESARCHLSGNRPCRAGSTLLIRGINFCLPYLPVKTPVTVDSLQQNIRADREERESCNKPWSSALPPSLFWPATLEHSQYDDGYSCAKSVYLSVLGETSSLCGKGSSGLC